MIEILKVKYGIEERLFRFINYERKGCKCFEIK